MPGEDVHEVVTGAVERAGAATVRIGSRGRGSGLVLAPGRVLTNLHNLRDSTTEVGFEDRAEQGTVHATDLDHDLVVLSVDTADTAPVEWGDPDVGVGDLVVGLSRSTTGLRATHGYVAQAGAAFRGPRGRRVKGAVEHTAPLARGASGGPLLDAQGRVVGVNTHRLGEGFYLAQPVTAALRDRLARLLEGESLRGRRLGIRVVPGPRARRLRRQVGLPDRAGLLVAGVDEGTPAAAAGLGEGDLLVAVDGAPVGGVDDLWDALDAAGEAVTVTVVRGSEERTVTVAFTTPG
jgi:S1-C subfamily serine protease